MTEKITKYKKYIISIVLIFLLSLFFLNLKYLLPKKYKEIPEVRLKEIVNKEKTFAIMIQNGEEYEEYSSNKWPDENYQFKEAKCVDNNGALVNNAITFTDGKATLETNQTIYCTLYFDKSTLGKLRESETLANKNNLSPEPNQGGMYRYQGTDDVSNWICFGTTDNCGTSDTLIDKYMYRIIGITEEGQLYLIKETFLKEKETIGFTWNDKYSTSETNTQTCDDKVCPEWPDSLLFKRINGISNGTTQGAGTINDKANTDIFVDSSEYEYLKSGDENGINDGIGSTWYQLIESHDWMYGNIGQGSDATLNTYIGQLLYAIETGNADVKYYVGMDGNNEEKTYRWNKETEPVSAKISLMYVHDYYYGYYDGININTRGNPGNATNVKNSWIYFQKDGYNTSPTYEWLSTRYGNVNASSPYIGALDVVSTGGWSTNGLIVTFGVRPVFYLSSKAKIINGKGTKSEPFILS